MLEVLTNSKSKRAFGKAAGMYGRGHKNLTFRNRNTLRITHCFYVRFMITLRKLPCNYARSTRVLRRQLFKTIRTYSYVHA